MSPRMQHAILGAPDPTKQSWGGGGSASTTSTTPAQTTEEKKDTLGEAGDFFKDAPQSTYYQPMPDEHAGQLASEFRQIFEDPQRQALERKLEEAIMNASVQEQRVRGNFSGFEDALRRREQEQSRLDLESAVARGAGRSGVVPHMSMRRQEHFGEMYGAQHANKMAELNAISEQLGLTQRQVPIELQQLAEQASRLEAQELQRLRDLDYSRGREYDMDQFQRMLNTFDRTHLTPFEQLQLYLEMAEVFGKSSAKLPSVTGGF